MSKKVLTRYQSMTNGNMAGSLTSEVTNIQFLDNVSIQINMSSADAAGAVHVQGSVDHLEDANGNVSNAGTFITIPSLSTTLVAGAPDNILIDVNQASYPYIQVIFTRTGGTGTMNVFISGKEI